MPDRYDPRNKRLAERLRQAREETGLTQTEAAERVGLNQSDISKIETGDRVIDVIRFLDLAALYGKPLNWFVEETDSSKWHGRSKPVGKTGS